jgi:hypothetical protein
MFDDKDNWSRLLATRARGNRGNGPVDDVKPEEAHRKVQRQMTGTKGNH